MRRYTHEDGDEDDEFKKYIWMIVIGVLFAAFVAAIPIIFK